LVVRGDADNKKTEAIVLLQRESIELFSVSLVFEQSLDLASGRDLIGKTDDGGRNGLGLQCRGRKEQGK
jgi:hypothetical protein